MKLKNIIKMFETENINKHCKVWGNVDIEINGMNLCNRQSSFDRIISYVVSDKYFDTIERTTNIVALIISDKDKNCYERLLEERNGAIICVNNPEEYFYLLHEFLYANTDFYPKYEFDSIIGDNCSIDDSAVIEQGVKIGDNVTIGANTVVKHGTVIQDNVCIGCNSTIGSEGFQIIACSVEQPMHITHAGGCVISKNVYIGDNTCICNSLFEGYTFVGDNTKIDNLVHVGHNLYIGKNVVITAHVILCGSACVEDGAWIAPNASIINRVTIGKYSKVGLGSVVTKDVAPYSVVYGNPAKTH